MKSFGTALEGEFGINKQAYNVHECFLLIIPEAISRGDENEMKVHR